MAARLVQRASRLLAVPVSLHPLSAPLPPECLRLCQLAPPVPCPAALHTSPRCHLTDTLPKLSNVPTTAEDNQQFYTKLKSLRNIEEVLQFVHENNLCANKAAKAVHHIAKLEDPGKQDLRSNKDFLKLLQTLDGQIHGMWNNHLIALLRSLKVLGWDCDDQYVKSVHVEMRWRIRKLSLESLGQLSNFVSPQSGSQEEKLLFDDLLKQVELRWMEIEESRSLVALVTKLGHKSKTLMGRLEDKVLELAGFLTPDESRKVIAALAAQNRRTLPVLRSLSYYLAQGDLPLAPSFIVDLAYAYGTLNFCQAQVLEKMMKDLVLQLSAVTPLNMTSVLRSISSLKFPSAPLCEAIAQAFVEGSRPFSASQICSVLFSFATLNFQPSQSQEFFSKVFRELEGESLERTAWVDLVWSLCILNQATPSYLQRVLDPEFYTKVLEGNSLMSLKYYQKLMQINAAALLEVPGYDGPFLPVNVLQTLQERLQSMKESRLRQGVTEALRSVFPDPNTLNYTVPSLYGRIIDGEIVVDSECKALPLENLVSPHNLQCVGTQPLPNGARRLAFLSQEFAFFKFNTKDLLGRDVMSMRHLRAAGFLVVAVPYYDWQELKSDWQKKSYLQDKVKKSVAEEMTP